MTVTRIELQAFHVTVSHRCVYCSHFSNNGEHKLFACKLTRTIIQQKEFSQFSTF